MPSERVDYDQLASRYNQRYEIRELSGIRDALEASRQGRVLEVGCGTGHWLRPADFGLDRSSEMLRHAGARVVNGDALHLPYRAETFDTIFVVNAIHHFGNPESFLHEAYRVLKAGGQLLIVGMSPRLQRDHWWIYDYFETTYATDSQRFPEWGAVVDWALLDGFREFRWRVVEHIEGSRTGQEIYDDPFLPKHRASQLALLTDEEYNAGLAKIATALREDPKTVFQWRLILGMLTLRK